MPCSRNNPIPSNQTHYYAQEERLLPACHSIFLFTTNGYSLYSICTQPAFDHSLQHISTRTTYLTISVSITILEKSIRIRAPTALVEAIADLINSQIPVQTCRAQELPSPAELPKRQVCIPPSIQPPNASIHRPLDIPTPGFVPPLP